MKSIMLASAAILSFATADIAVAREMPVPASQPPADGATDTPPTPDASPPDADPNAGQPTGAVPADPGMAPAPAGVPQNPDAPVGSPANPVTVGGNMTPPPTEAKDYPVCSKAVQDSCINPQDARKMRKPH